MTTNEIGRSVTEAAKGVGDIAKNIGGVAVAAKNTTQGANDTQKASQELSQMAAQLQKVDLEVHVLTAAEREMTMSKALVVDDSRAVRMILAKTLRGLGYEVREAANGREALEVIEAEKTAVTLVLADWNMPEMNGLELLKRLRQKPELASIGGGDGHYRDGSGSDGGSARSGRQRVRHEAVHQRHTSREAADGRDSSVRFRG